MLDEEKKQVYPTMLRQIRQEIFDMKQDEFALWLGITQGTVSRCENGKTEITMTARQWHRFFSRLESKLGIPILRQEPLDLSSRGSIDQWIRRNSKKP